MLGRMKDSSERLVVGDQREVSAIDVTVELPETPHDAQSFFVDLAVVPFSR